MHILQPLFRLFVVAALAGGCSLLYPFELPEQDGGDGTDGEAETEGGEAGDVPDGDVPPTCDNGEIDPGELCDTAAAPATCSATCGSTGTERCIDCTSVACDPPMENCNGADDDCDGETDEGYPCIEGTAVACTTPCGLAGTGLCAAGCELPTRVACASPAEACNGCDDTRDGSTDEGCACESAWAVEHPLAPGPESLQSIAVGSDGHAFAVGVGGVILQYDGAEWTRGTPPAVYNLRWVDALRGDFAVAVGSSGAVVWWNGTDWTFDDASGTTWTLYGVSIVDENDVWAGGANGTMIHWDGTGWTDSPTGSTRHFYRVLALGHDDVYAVGTAGTVMHYDGTGWTRISSAAMIAEIETVWTPDGDQIWVAGTDGFISRWERSTGVWTPTPSGTLETIYALWGSAGDDIWGVGGYTGGIVLHWNGAEWTEDRSVVSIEPQGLLSADGTAANDIFVSARDGGILHYDGASWQPMEGAVTTSVRALWGRSGQEVYAVGSATNPDGESSSALLRYDGFRWSLESWRPGIDAQDMWTDAEPPVFVVGGDEILRRFDGAAWATAPVGMFPNIRLFGAWGVPGGEVFLVGDQDYAGGPPMAFQGTVGAWTSLLTPTLPDVDLLDVAGTTADDVVMVGTGGTILRRSGTSDLVQDVSGTSETLRSVWVDASGEAFAVGDNGTILHWDGSAWSAMTAPSDPWFGTPLHGVWGTSPTNVFAVGASGTLLRYRGGSWTTIPLEVVADLTDVWGTLENNVFVVANDRSGIIVHRCGAGW